MKQRLASARYSTGVTVLQNLVKARKLLREGWRIQLSFDPEKKLLEPSAFRFA